jgi:hypothetical protein
MGKGIFHAEIPLFNHSPRTSCEAQLRKPAAVAAYTKKQKNLGENTSAFS